MPACVRAYACLRTHAWLRTQVNVQFQFFGLWGFFSLPYQFISFFSSFWSGKCFYLSGFFFYDDDGLILPQLFWLFAVFPGDSGENTAGFVSLELIIPSVFFIFVFFCLLACLVG